MDFRNPVLWAALLPGLVAVPVLALKVQLLCVAFITMRAGLPRLRFDQLTNLCWKYLFPLALSGSLLVMGLHYGFTLYYLAQETRTFGLYWLPHYGCSLEMNGYPTHSTRMVNTHFWQLRGTFLCVTE